MNTSQLKHQDLNDLFQQGNPEEIAAALNSYFAPHGITAKVAWKSFYLGILLEAPSVPDRDYLLPLFQQLCARIAVDSIEAVRLYGKQIGQVAPTWSEEISLASSTPSDSHSVSVADWLSQGSKSDPTTPMDGDSQGKHSDLAKFLRFYFSPQDTALLPLKNVKEVLNIPLMGILPVPHMSDCTIGIYNYRGEIIWLADLGAQLGFIPSTELIQGMSSASELAASKATTLTANKGINLTSELPTITVIIVQNEDKSLGIVVPKVVDIELHDLQEMQYPTEDLFAANILPFLKGYLIRSSSPVLDINALIEDRMLKCDRNS